MNHTKSIASATLGFFFLAAQASAAPLVLPNPDFTKGETIPAEAKKDWNLGATGARGWMYTNKSTTTEARQIFITKIAAGSPADGFLQTGDVILGIAGKLISFDPRTEFGKALTTAEAKDGKLSLTRWREGKTEEITITLPVLGSYSKTAPYDCEKSKRILEQGCEALSKRMNAPGYERENAISRSLNALGLLASGDSKYAALVKREADWAAKYSTDGYGTWWYGYVSVFLAEYAISTGDKSVIPGLRRIVLEAAKGQSAVGSWGHRYAMPDGRLLGYGMMNSPGIPLTIGLVLAREAGIDDPEVAQAIERSGNLLRFFIGKGSVPYGDHDPFMQSHEDNGKNGMATVLFDQLGEKDGAEFFAKMSAASHGGERDQGHTGNFFNMTWAMPGVARGGPHATGAWMEEFGAWYFDLARAWDGAFPHQGPAQPKDDSYGKWDATGMYLISYAMPLKKIRITGSKPSIISPLDEAKARQVVLDGRGFQGYGTFTAFDGLPPDILFELLQSWSPITRARASMAYSRRAGLPIEPLIAMLDQPSLEARLGACEALGMFGNRAAAAVPKLHETLSADDLWLRVMAAKALNAIGKPAMSTVPDMLRMAIKGPTKEDPRGMEQRYLIKFLFSSRGGLLGHSLEGVDRELLFQVVRAGLKNEDGSARGALGPVLKNLSFDALQPLMPVIHRAILDKSPSGEMFDGQIQMSALELFSRNRVNEGIELIADHVRLQKAHGSQVRIIAILDLLKPYGAHAQRAIPNLEKAIHYFENEEKDLPRSLSLEKAAKVRQAIAEIKAASDKPPLVQLKS